MLADDKNATSLFNGRDLTGWQGNAELWSVENGEIIGRSQGLKKNEFLVSEMAAANFKLSFDVKLVGNAGNSGVQFRSSPEEHGVRATRRILAKAGGASCMKKKAAAYSGPSRVKSMSKKGNGTNMRLLRTAVR